MNTARPVKLRRWLLGGAILYAALVIGVIAVLRRYVGELPPIQSLETYTPSLVTKVYDINNQLISELFVEKRTVVPLPEIPLYFRQAMLAIEDVHFYEHWGVYPKGIVRAAVANLKAGRAVQGGSTITQQLAKNIFLTHRRTFTRKIKELLLTLQIERNFSKDEILQLYMNQVYFGSGAYGVQTAAKTFFGKEVAELTLPESALLAGLPKAPRYYSPMANPARATARRNLVLRRLWEENFISQMDYLKALNAPMKLASSTTTTEAAYFVEQVRLALEPKYGSTALLRGGFSIYTTLDLRMQSAAEISAEKHLKNFDDKAGEDRLKALLKEKKITEDYFNRWKKWKEKPEAEREPEEWPEPVNVQGALVAIDPQTGGIRAMVGGRDFQKSQFNRATQAKRQPGSSFKPFVWLAALQSGFTAASVVDDYPLAYTNVERNPQLVAEATDYAMLREMVTGYYLPDRKPEDPDPVWTPNNWDQKFLGPVTLRRGLALSRNLVSVRLIDRVGPRSVVALAKSAGIESPMDPVLSLALGTSVLTPEELVSAYSTFANGGVHMEPFFIVKVVDQMGKVLEERAPQGRVALAPQSNFLITRLMQAVVQEGTGRGALRLGRAAAGKTGTTQDQRDLWFVGFIPNLSAGVWIGYDDFIPMGKELTSAGSCVPWWTDFMAESAKYLPPQEFQAPAGIVFAKIDSDTGYLALPSCRRVVLEAFRQDGVPQEFCPVNHELQDEKEGVVEITE